MAKPTCFISYSWDSDEHKAWVRSLATKLQLNGVVTRLDQWDVHPGMDLPEYVETSIRESDCVLLVCTPTFARKANAGTGGVGYEKIVVTGELFQGAAAPGKFVPILRKGEPSDSLPSYLKPIVFTDFRNDAAFDSALEHVLRHLHKLPKHRRPPLGKPPTFLGGDTASSSSPSHSAKQPERLGRARFREAHDYARNPLGMGLSAGDAEVFAKYWVENHSGEDLGAFKQAYAYARSPLEMGLSAGDAEVFAKYWVENHSEEDLGAFKQAYAYARSPLGMGKSAGDAEVFAKYWVENHPGEGWSNLKPS